MVTLKSGNSVLKIEELGAEMKSFIVDGIEYLWVGSEKYWNKSCPNIFPMTGGFRDDKYILNGKEYHMNKHGFSMNMIFEVESKTEDSAVFLLKSNEKTKVSFPFDFEFRVCYKVDCDKIFIDYKVTNLSKEKMWFSVGSHDGFACPEGIEEYDLIFPQNETLNAYTIYGNLIGKENTPVIKDSNKIELNYDYFEIDALIFKDVKSDSCRLINRKTGRGIQLDYGDAPFFVVWTKPGAPYLCIEPWYGIADNVDSDYDITHKEGIQSVDADDTFIASRTITVFDGK